MLIKYQIFVPPGDIKFVIIWVFLRSACVHICKSTLLSNIHSTNANDNNLNKKNCNIYDYGYTLARCLRVLVLVLCRELLEVAPPQKVAIVNPLLFPQQYSIQQRTIYNHQNLHNMKSLSTVQHSGQIMLAAAWRLLCGGWDEDDAQGYERLKNLGQILAANFAHRTEETSRIKSNTCRINHWLITFPHQRKIHISRYTSLVFFQ